MIDPLMAYKDFLLANSPVVLGILAGMTIWFASGGLAASIAEKRNHQPLVHLVLGMAIPVFYPLLIQFTMKWKSKGKKHKRAGDKDEKIMHMEGAPPPEAPPALTIDDEFAAAPTADAALLEANKIQYDQLFFKQKTYDDGGNYRGPFIFTVDGNEIKVERIINTMENVVVIENLDSDGKPQHLRIPYSRIEAFQEIT